jgi:hypothetical protein
MDPLRNWLPNISNACYYKQERYLWACGKVLGDRKPNIPFFRAREELPGGESYLTINVSVTNRRVASLFYIFEVGQPINILHVQFYSGFQERSGNLAGY